MFRAKTVLVIGAGASVELGLPEGSDLLRQIVNLTNLKFDHNQLNIGDPAILAALRLCMNEGEEVDQLNEHIRAGWQLSQSAQQAISIDNVIDALEDKRIELVGKLGIVRAILMAENSSAPFKKIGGRSFDLTGFEGTWYNSLTKLLTENVRKSEINSIFDNLQIINFNYDRCIEHYLPKSLGSYYGVGDEAIREVMPNLTIHRPYGVAGRLPWQKGTAPSVGFGEGSAEQLANIAQEIRTFTERVEEGDELVAIRAAIADADRLVFLGFGFHRQNVELLSHAVQDHTEILATAYRIPKSAKSIIENELGTAFGQKYAIMDERMELSDLTCEKSFRSTGALLPRKRVIAALLRIISRLSTKGCYERSGRHALQDACRCAVSRPHLPAWHMRFRDSVRLPRN